MKRRRTLSIALVGPRVIPELSDSGPLLGVRVNHAT